MRKITYLLRQFIDPCLNDLFPPKCLACLQDVSTQSGICQNCWEQLKFITSPLCLCCGLPFPQQATSNLASLICPACHKKKPAYDQARSALAYNEISRNLILRFKHGDQTHLALLFSTLLTQQMINLQDQNGAYDMIVPIPLHWKRLAFRRYNQAALLAAQLAKKHQIPFHPELLKRHKATASQGHLSRKARQRNLKNAFQLFKASTFTGGLEHKKILLIDDVYTTGSTAEEAASCLKKAGAQIVTILTVARVIHPHQLPR